MANISFKYILKRFLSAVLTLWVALTFNFLLPRMMGGNPADYLASQNAMGSLEYAEKIEAEFGLDKNIAEQYVKYITGLLQGNLGISYTNFPVAVSDIITKAMPWTLLIVLISTFLSFSLAWILGIIAAMKKGSVFDNVVVGGAFAVQSIPYFWVGMLIVMWLGFYSNFFPMGHAMTPGQEFISTLQLVGNIAYHAVLPILSLVIVTLAGRMIMMRSNILQVFSEDYILLAQAKGLRRNTIFTKYALRNAMLPSFTGLMLSLGQAVGGAIATEIIFSYPGIGLTIMNAIFSQDYPLIQGCFAIIALSVVIINFIADLIYPIIDPRVSLS